MKRHEHHARAWPAMLAVVVLVAAHAALFGFAFWGHTSLALLTAVAGVLALKYVWWRFRL